MIQLVGVPPASIDRIWSRLDSVFEEACKHTRGALTKEAIYHRAHAGQGQIWIAADDTTEVTAACFTSTVGFPGGLRAMFVEIIGGTIKYDIFEFRATLEKQAAALGCAAVYFLIPRRWQKKQQQYMADYKVTHLLVCKELGQP